MKRLTVQEMGSKVQGVRLNGQRSNPEPETFRVSFPGGDVDIVRTTDEQYWVHVRVNTRDDCIGIDLEQGQITDARLDIEGRHASECDVGDFGHPDLYHLAVKVRRIGGER